MSTNKSPAPNAAAETSGADGEGVAPAVAEARAPLIDAWTADAWVEAASAEAPAVDAIAEGGVGDGRLETPVLEESATSAPTDLPPASREEGVPQSTANEARSDSGPQRPMAATMAGPMALSGAAAEAVPVTIGGQVVPAEARPGDALVDGYLGTVVADRYKILRKLGEGGMGTVYLAEHILIEKRVALKVLSEDFARKADLVQRFMQEAKAASRIGHENIVDITDFGETPSGSVFIAMEFLEGQDLAATIRSAGALPFDRCRHIVTQICRALGAAHAKGIIHRDMKPENVYLIEREGRTDFAKILDFGIAKISSIDEVGSRLTRTGMIFGTPEYMSPEQARGDRPDHRVDIYAVGCILYEMLTGDVPFHADTFMGVLTKHMFEQPIAPSQRAPDRNIPPEVEAVVLKALAKDRDQRFLTMKEMSMALAACGGNPAEGWGNEPSGVFDMAVPSTRSGSSLSGKSVPSVAAVTPGPSEASSAEPEERKSNALRWGLIVGALVALAGVVGVFGYSNRAAPPPPIMPTPVAPSPVTATTAVTPATKPVAPTTATLSIRSVPTGAEIYRGKELLGNTPYALVLPIAQHEVTLQLKKRDFKDRDITVVPDKDRSYDFDLLAVVKKASQRVAPNPAAPPTAAPPKGAAVAKPPAGRLRDLKDPFGDEPAKSKH